MHTLRVCLPYCVHDMVSYVALQHDLSRSCDQVRTLLTQLSTQERGGATEDKRIRQAKEQIWTKLEVSKLQYPSRK